MPKLNPNEAPEGYVARKANEGKTCEGCDFFSADGSCGQNCFPSLRYDKSWVIFKRKPTKPVRKPREWMAWGVVGYEGYVWKLGKTRRQARNLMVDDEQVIRVKITEAV